MYHLRADEVLFAADLTKLILEALKRDIHSGDLEGLAIKFVSVSGYRKNVKFGFDIHSPQHDTHISGMQPQQLKDLADYTAKILKVLEPMGLGIDHLQVSNWDRGRFSVIINVQDKWWEEHR